MTPAPAATAAVQPWFTLSLPHLTSAINFGTALVTFVTVVGVAAAGWLLVPKALLRGRIRSLEADKAELQSTLVALVPALNLLRSEVAMMRATQAESTLWIADVIVAARKRGTTIPDPPASIREAIAAAVHARELEHDASVQGAGGVAMAGAPCS